MLASDQTSGLLPASPQPRGHLPVRPPWLHRLGRYCGRHPFRVFAAWVLLLIVVAAGARVGGGTFSDNLNLSGTESHTGLAVLQANDPQAGGYAGQVVIHSAKGSVSAQSAVVDQSAANLAKLPHVLSVANPLDSVPPAVSANGQIANMTIHFDEVPKSLGSSYIANLDAAVAPMRQVGLEVEYGGQLDGLTRPKASDLHSELIGFAVAAAVLLVGFGSVAAAALPLVTALFSVLIALSLLTIVASLITFGTASPTLAVMIGLGVGIDYALFSTTRFRQLIADGADAADAAGTTTATSGRAVLVAAGTVTVAMLGLYASGVTFIGELGFAAVFGVATAAAGALTLVPAALGLLGRGIDRLAVRKPVAETGSDGDGWHRYAAFVGRHPWRFLAAGTVLLAVLALPLFSMRLGHVGDGADPHSYTDKRAYDLISDGFGPGANGPFTIVIQLNGTTGPAADQLATRAQQAETTTPGVAKAGPLTPTANGAVLVGTVVPTTGPQDQATTEVFHRLLNTSLPEATHGTGATAYVTGATASAIQFTDTLSARLPIIIVVVAATAFLLIVSAFRSPLLALKAAVFNLLSIGAAYGVIVAVFQWGWGRSLIGVSQNVPIESYVPMIMFAIVFGLSMDYEVFLLSHVQESWIATGDAKGSVAKGLSQTGRVISCAALIMVSVFLAFVGSNAVVTKMLAVGLAFSVLIDATVVRLLLVPAAMNILGRSAWWMPRRLDRLIPHLDPDGSPA